MYPFSDFNCYFRIIITITITITITIIIIIIITIIIITVVAWTANQRRLLIIPEFHLTTIDWPRSLWTLHVYHKSLKHQKKIQYPIYKNI